jgi:hypothetical protein
LGIEIFTLHVPTPSNCLGDSSQDKETLANQIILEKIKLCVFIKEFLGLVDNISHVALNQSLGSLLANNDLMEEGFVLSSARWRDAVLGGFLVK